ncbi:MAG: DNA methyltransferase [Candidatus Micrarchaeaceae archaeon]
MNEFGIFWKNKRTEVEKIPLPFQTVETINLGRKTIGTLGAYRGEDSEWTNKLIWGDNIYVLSSLLAKFAGKIKLIYIDPPFFTGTNMNITIQVGEDKAVKEPSAIEEIAYRNMWKEGPSSFFQFMYDRLVLMKELLSEDGSIWVRFDYHYSHYIKGILDEVFGYDNFRNELIINRTKKNVMASRAQTVFPTATDSLFFYAKSENMLLIETKIKVTEERKGFWRHMDDSAGQGSAKVFFGKSMEPPPGKHWKFSQENIDRMVREGKLRLNPKTGRPEYWVEPSDEYVLDTNWTDIPGYSFTTGYPTENSEQLLERVILSGSNQGDLVADFFAGSGTTVAVAERLGRRWIAVDIGRFSIHTIRKRLLDIPQCKPFEILNLGKYERKYWMEKEHGDIVRKYFDFILSLYHAKPVTYMTSIHGILDRKAVHVGYVDYPVTKSEIEDAVNEAKKNSFGELDVLGWEFEMGLNETAIKEIIESSNIKVNLKKIPTEVMDKRAVDNGDIQFFELAFLDIEVQRNNDEVVVHLKNFIIPNPEEVPDEVREKIKKWSDYIDYWSIDWDYNNDVFHNQWQDFRTKNNMELKLKSIPHHYEKGRHLIMIKVIDIFGNDTTKVEGVDID